MNKQIITTLEELGLTSGESRIYHALCKLGRTKVSKIIKESGVSSSKVYIILEKLHSKGLVRKEIQNKSKLYIASPAENLLDYIENKKSELEKLKKQTKKIIPFLQKANFETEQNSLIEFSSGKKGFKMYFMELIETMGNKREIQILTSHKIYQRFMDTWKLTDKIIKEQGLTRKIVFDNKSWDSGSKKYRAKKKNYFPKVLPCEYEDLPNIIIGNNKSIVINTQKNKVTTIMIRNSELTNALKKLLSLIRKEAKVPKGFEPNTVKSN